jgi:hypothetical protein
MLLCGVPLRVLGVALGPCRRKSTHDTRTVVHLSRGVRVNGAAPGTVAGRIRSSDRGPLSLTVRGEVGQGGRTCDRALSGEENDGTQGTMDSHSPSPPLAEFPVTGATAPVSARCGCPSRLPVPPASLRPFLLWAAPRPSGRRCACSQQRTSKGQGLPRADCCPSQTPLHSGGGWLPDKKEHAERYPTKSFGPLCVAVVPRCPPLWLRRPSLPLRFLLLCATVRATHPSLRCRALTHAPKLGATYPDPTRTR